MKLIAIGVMVACSGQMARAELIQFQCSWEDAKPINIRVDTSAMKATRDDGGKSYTVIKATSLGVWLLVDEPENVAAAKMQFIQRPAAIKPDNAPADWNKAGKWIDVVSSVSGMISPIDGGKCWESPPGK